MLTGSGEVLSSAREPALSTWLVSATPAPVASAPAPSWPSGDSVAAARNAPAGTRSRVCSRSQPESTPGILSAKNSAAASAPDTPSTHDDCGHLQRRRQVQPAQRAGQADAEHGQVDADPGQPGQHYANCEQVRIRHGGDSLD